MSSKIESRLKKTGEVERKLDLSIKIQQETRRRVASVMAEPIRTLSLYGPKWIPVYAAAVLIICVSVLMYNLSDRSTIPSRPVEIVEVGDIEIEIDEMRMTIAGEMDQFSFRYEWPERVSVLDLRKDMLRDDMEMCWLDMEAENFVNTEANGR